MCFPTSESDAQDEKSNRLIPAAFVDEDDDDDEAKDDEDEKDGDNERDEL